MGFAAIARVTENRWIACSTKDNISFGLKPGDELKVETTLCHEVREHHKPIIIDNVDKDANYKDHHTPALYNIQSYVSVPIFRKDGSFFGTLCALDPNPARIKISEIDGMFHLFADLISFHLNAVEEVELATAKLEEEKVISELRDKFIAILGHDLKNPVATTRMSAEILLQSTKEEVTKRHAGLIKSTSYRMQGLIENILDFARGQLGEGITLERKSNNGSLSEIIKQIVKEVKTSSPTREIKINFSIQTPVFCDVNRIGQLFSNLLTNAVTHGATDSPIEVTASTESGLFKLTVINQGDKIPESAMKHLFQPFYREDIKPGKQGLGLGLFIASEIAKAHGGIINVESTEEKTSFTMEIPVEVMEPQE